MPRDNKPSIEQNPNNNHAKLHIDRLQQYLMLCHDVL